MNKELMWIIYLADGRKMLFTQSEWERILDQHNRKKIGEDEKGNAIYLTAESVFISGVEVASAVREDFDGHIPDSQIKMRLLN